MHLCHIHIDRTAERVVRRRKRREQTGSVAIFVIKAWSTEFKKKKYCTGILACSNL